MYRFTWRINCHSYFVLRSRAARLAGRGDSCASASMKELGCRWRFEKLPMFLAVLASKKFIGEWLECWKQSSIINDHTLETGLIFLGGFVVQKINSWWPDDSRVCGKLNAFGQKPAKCCMTIHQIFFQYPIWMRHCFVRMAKGACFLLAGQTMQANWVLCESAFALELDWSLAKSTAGQLSDSQKPFAGKKWSIALFRSFSWNMWEKEHLQHCHTGSSRTRTANNHRCVIQEQLSSSCFKKVESEVAICSSSSTSRCSFPDCKVRGILDLSWNFKIATFAAFEAKPSNAGLCTGNQLYGHPWPCCKWFATKTTTMGLGIDGIASLPLPRSENF